MTTKAEELWEKYCHTHAATHDKIMTLAGFAYALQEYGAAVRARDAEEVTNIPAANGYVRGILAHAAAAIEREPLP